MAIRSLLLRLSLALALFCALAPASRAQLSRLKFGSYKISSISPRSLRSCDGAVQVSVRNDTVGFVMRNISGLVYRSGVPFVTGQASDVDVRPGRNTLVVPGNVTLCDGVSLWTILGLLFSFDINEYTADLRLTLTTDTGDSRVIEEKGMSVAAVLGNRFKRKK
ncbi:MAG: hypothetical protein IJV01_05735 [Bacteroidales bacterium]|nr:hypothetical protein [Bacteroidales bacterium]